MNFHAHALGNFEYGHSKEVRSKGWRIKGWTLFGNCLWHSSFYFLPISASESAMVNLLPCFKLGQEFAMSSMHLTDGHDLPLLAEFAEAAFNLL